MPTNNLSVQTSYPQQPNAWLPSVQAAVLADEVAMLSLTPGSTALNISGTSGLYNNGIGSQGDQTMVGGNLIWSNLAAPSAPTLSTNGTAGSTTYDYTVEAVLGTGTSPASAATAITTGNATLSATNSINITFNQVVGATSFNVRRTVGGATQGIIIKVPATGAVSYTVIDTGITGDASVTPTLNTTCIQVGLAEQSLVTVYSANGAVTAFGLGVITKAGVAVMTLAAPVAGARSAGGMDGAVLNLVDTGGHAHTVTTGTNGYNGSTHIATFGGTVGNNMTVKAYNGVWYVTGANGVTLS
jgi:hypothetical protein